jgi:type I restriction enzyme M protein
VRKAILATFSERDENAAVCMDADGNIEPDPELRDTENVPLKEAIHVYFDREVKPHVPDAWIDEDKTKIGYEIPLTRHRSGNGSRAVRRSLLQASPQRKPNRQRLDELNRR